MYTLRNYHHPLKQTSLAHQNYTQPKQGNQLLDENQNNSNFNNKTQWSKFEDKNAQFTFYTFCSFIPPNSYFASNKQKNENKKYFFVSDPFLEPELLFGYTPYPTLPKNFIENFDIVLQSVNILHYFKTKFDHCVCYSNNYKN